MQMDKTSERSSKRPKLDDLESCLKVNDFYIQHEDEISETFCKNKALTLENEAEVICDPFQSCVLPNFIQSEKYLRDLKEELTQLDLEQKRNDLYQFQQSKDLVDTSLPHTSNFITLLRKDVLRWLKSVTKIPLTEKIDLFFSCYTFTDHLLCHDDELEGRRIAFIFYLVPEWNIEDGGLLDLFNAVDGQPTDVSRSIIPKWNNFVFFEVSPVSYHQVSEVLSSKKRMALSGWFHGPPLEPSVPVNEPILFKEPVSQEIDITQWINPMYLAGEILLEISETFEENSEISLPNFLNAEKYEAVSKALSNEVIEWKKKGPPNYKTVYEAKSSEETPLILRDCQALFCSEAFLLILSNLTGLKLHPACDEDAKIGKVASCIRKWGHGSYSLLHKDSFSQEACLHATMYFNCSDWDPDCGGYTSFVAIEEEDELLRIEPDSNSLALVYVTKYTSPFVKYINSKSKQHPSSVFYDIFCTYIEDEDNKSEE